MQRCATLAGLSAILSAAGATADWQTITLDNYAHGQVLDGELLGPASAHADNFHHAQSRLVAFDTLERGTHDPDLEGPDGQSGGWTKGNIDAGEMVGTVLIVQEAGHSSAGGTGTSAEFVDHPNDEERQQDGRRPGAGEITLAFDQPVSAFRFMLFDIEQTQAFENQTGSYVVFIGGGERVKIAFAELIDPDSEYFDPSVRFGDHSANHFPSITADEIGLIGIEQVVVNFGGSGAIGGISYLDDPLQTIGFATTLTNEGSIFSSGQAAFADYASENAGSPEPGGGSTPSPPTDDPDDDDDPEPVGVPTPGAGAAGALLISLLVARRPRRA